MDHPEITEKICEKYSRRFDMLIKALNELGFDTKKPKGSFYCYVKCPKGTAEDIEFKNAADAAKYFIEKALISVVPWDDAGSYLRIWVTFEASSQVKEEMIICEIKRRLKALNLVF